MAQRWFCKTAFSRGRGPCARPAAPIAAALVTAPAAVARAVPLPRRTVVRAVAAAAAELRGAYSLIRAARRRARARMSRRPAARQRMQNTRLSARQQRKTCEGFSPGASAGGVVWHDEHRVARARQRDERRARGGGAQRGGAVRQRLIAERCVRAEQHLGCARVGARARAPATPARAPRADARACVRRRACVRDSPRASASGSRARSSARASSAARSRARSSLRLPSRRRARARAAWQSRSEAFPAPAVYLDRNFMRFWPLGTPTRSPGAIRPAGNGPVRPWAASSHSHLPQVRSLEKLRR